MAYVGDSSGMGAERQTEAWVENQGIAELLAEDAVAEQHHKGFTLGMNWGLLHQLDAAGLLAGDVATELDITKANLAENAHKGKDWNQGHGQVSNFWFRLV